MKKENRRGFTLAEMLIVSLLVAAIALAIFSTFNNGMKIWLKANEVVFEEDLNIFFDKFSREARNSLDFKGIAFLGKSDRLELPTLVDSPRIGKRTLGKVIYSYDLMTYTVSREERDYSHIYRDHEGVVTQTLPNVGSLRFFYYYYNEKLKDYLWTEEWPKEAGFPIAIKMALELKRGNKVGRYTKTVDIPIGAR